MKIVALTLSQQLKQQQLQNADISMLKTALRHLQVARDDIQCDLDMANQLYTRAQQIIGKTDDKIAQMCKEDSFLELLIEEYWNPPYEDVLAHREKELERCQESLNTVETDLVKIYDLLNPSVEFLTSMLHAIQNKSFHGDRALNDDNPLYNPYAYDNLKKWIPLLKKIKQPQFNGFSNAEKIELLLGPILLFMPETDFVSKKDLDALINKYHMKSGNLTTLLCESQRTLFVPPQLYRFAFSPIKDEYDRALLRLTAFTDAIIAVRDYLTKSNAQNPFEPMERVGLTNFTAVVNWWCKKTWPDVRNKLDKKQCPLTDIIPIVQNMAQNFLILPGCWKNDYREEAFAERNWEQKHGDSDPNYVLSAKEYQAAFRLMARHLPNYSREDSAYLTLIGVPYAFTPEKFDKLKDDKNFFDWIFVEEYMSQEGNVDKETIYGIVGNLDFNHRYFKFPSMNHYNPQKLDRCLSALAQKYKLLQPSPELLNFVAKSAKER